MAHQLPFGAGWLPSNFHEWAAERVKSQTLTQASLSASDTFEVKSQTSSLSASDTLEVIKEFQDLIETTPAINMAFTRMFDQTMQNLDLRGEGQVQNYMQMLQAFNSFLRQAPSYWEQVKWGGLIAFPFNAVIDWPMSSPAGIEVFTMPAVNDQLKKVFNEWAKYLRSQASRDEVIKVGTTQEPGWISEQALEDLARNLTDTQGNKITFKQAYVCDEKDTEHLGFTSWDDFFTRSFKASIRPVPADIEHKDNVIVAACESDLNRIYMDVKHTAKFWVKSQPYSVSDILHHDPDYAKEFGSGSAILQAFLSARSYHRWHSPIAGTIVKSYIVPGTYYALCPSSDLDPSAPDLSQPYITQMATRALVFIRGTNKDIGLMCLVAVGMAEVSSCELTVFDGQPVSKGDQLGMFHHGGSSHCLIFRPETAAKLKWNKAVIAEPPGPKENKNYPDDATYHIMLRQQIAHV